MKKGKKITALILAAMLAVSSSAAMAVTVSAEENTAVAYSSSDTKTWGDYDYQVLDDGTVEIMHYKGSDTNLVIPSEIDGKKVTSIGNLYGNRGIISVEIPNSVKNIGDGAFDGFSSLKNIIIPDSVTSIGSCAFENCTSLTEVKIPNSVKVIGIRTFRYCISLTKIEIPDSVEYIQNFAFNHCENLKDVKIPDSVIDIGSGTFSYCKSLKDVTIPSSVTNIEGHIFNSCSNLLSINVSENNTCYSSLDGILFNKEKTELLEYPAGKSGEYVIPNDVISISGFAFEDCNNLTSIEIPDSVTSIGAFAFSCCKKLTSVIIPSSVTSIGDGAFEDTPWYNSQPDGLLYAGKVAYRYKGEMPKNTKITLKDDTVEISGYAFFACGGLTNIEIPNSVTSIGELAFAGCTSLTSIEIPDSVTSIGYHACGYNIRGMTEKITGFTIYGTKGTAAETYANENGFKFVDINKKITTLTSKVDNISVNGTFDDGVILNVEKATVKNAVKAYNITLKDENGNTIQPNGKITVSIPSDNANCKVYWIKEDGTKVDMNATYSNGNYEFTTDHLSVYALIADTTEPSQESSGEQNNSSSESSGEQSNNPSEPSNNTNSSKTTSETGKNAVNTGDNNNAVAIATIFAIGALIAAIIMRKKKA